MGITTTIAKLKTYFDAWHATAPHDNLKVDVTGDITNAINTSEEYTDGKIQGIQNDLNTNIYHTSITCDKYNPKKGEIVTISVKVTDYSHRPTVKMVTLFKDGQVYGNPVATASNTGVAEFTWEADSYYLTTFSANGESIQCYVDNTDWEELYYHPYGENGKNFEQDIRHKDGLVSFTFITSPVNIVQNKWMNCGYIQLNKDNVKKYRPPRDIYIQNLADIVIRVNSDPIDDPQHAHNGEYPLEVTTYNPNGYTQKTLYAHCIYKYGCPKNWHDGRAC